MKNVNKPPFRRPLSISVLSCVASVIGCSWFSNVLVQMHCPRQTTSSADAQVRGGSVIGASAGPASDDSSYFVLTRLVDDDDAEDTKSNEQQMSSVNEITTVNHATYFTAQCRLLVCLSILRSYSWPIIGKHMTSSTKQEYITYRNASRRWPMLMPTMHGGLDHVTCTTMQQYIAGSESVTVCTMDSSCLGVRNCLKHDAINTTQKGR